MLEILGIVLLLSEINSAALIASSANTEQWIFTGGNSSSLAI